MEKQRCDFWYILFMAVILAIFAAMPVSNAATISGTVYKEDGSSPVNDANIAVNVYEGAPCGTYQVVAQDTTSDGSFVIAGLSPGTYYLKAEKVSGTPGYIDEWWADAGSIWDCWGAEAVTITSSEDVLSNKNFQLELFGSISGTLYDANGALIGTRLDVKAFRGSSCEDAQWINAQVAANPTYTITNVPPGTYYVRSSNKGDTWYVNEYHTVSGSTNNGVSYTCDGAIQVTVNSGTGTPNIDFQLDSGGRISGTVYKSDGITPITDADIRVNPYEGGACEGQGGVSGTMTSNGNYTISGLPAGSYYIQAFRDSGANYINEWYNVPLSSYDCNDADPVQVWVGVETQNIHFQLDSGGSITGRLVDENGQPLGNVEVKYDHEGPGNWQQTWSDPADGTFTLSGLGVGGTQITIFSDPGRYLAGFIRNYYLEAGENKNIGTLTVQKGAVISGMVAKGGTPLADFELVAGAKLTMAEVDSGADGTFSFVLPPGEFTINNQEDFFATAPQTVVVAEADIMTNKSIPTTAAYDVSNGDVYNGTVTINVSPPTGARVMVLSFMNDEEFDLNNWGATNPLSIGGLFDGLTASNPYELATPPGSAVQLMLALYSEWNDGNKSLTLIESTSDVTGGGTYNYTYNNIGSTLDGYVIRNGEPAYWALVGLYRETGNEFAGFAYTDHTGHYVFYNVSDGTYGVDVTAEDYDGIVKTPNVLVNNNLTIPTIELEGQIAKDELAIDFKTTGIFVYNAGSWNKIYKGIDPEALCSFGTYLAVDFGITYGLYVYDAGAWTRVYKGVAIEKMAGFGGKLAVDFGTSYPIYEYNFATDTWTPIYNYSSPRDTIEALGDKLVVDFKTAGIYVYDAGIWNRIYKGVDPVNIVSFGDKLAIDFGITYGLYVYKYDTDTWTRVYKGVAIEKMAEIDGDLVVDFGTAHGLYVYEFDTDNWTRVYKGVAIEKMAGFDGNLAVDFGTSYPIYEYNFGTDNWNSIYNYSSPRDELVPANIF